MRTLNLFVLGTVALLGLSVGAASTSPPPSLPQDPCNGSGGVSTATGWQLDGGCWSPAVINVETGVWYRACDLEEDTCDFSFAFTEGGEPKALEMYFTCGEGGQAGGNGNNTLWWSNACLSTD